ncbi:hypothetical protein [Candidatus Albibeggiatoa sp. nov. BB20]|uniref:hypothetical protein n=1 Tax=Candidatus Albibeggiatoa sp. nov. BB20 TaxID=3162723 RepID=UPI0033653413
MSKYFVLLNSIDENVEEEVNLNINGIELTCFASICPYKIYARKQYWVSFNFMIFDDYEVLKLEGTSDIGFERVGESFDYFAYWLKGQLKDGMVDCGIQFETDEVLLAEYGDLEGKFVKLRVDRIDVEFLEE